LICPLANYDELDRDTTPVDRYIDGVSPIGAYDMAGNVWQMLADWYGEYPEDELVNPVGPFNGTHRVTRGSAWNEADTVFLRVSNRGINAPNNTGNNIGFRCVYEDDANR
jgi:eukaryotic-like serine/threonine-protein kinase